MTSQNIRGQIDPKSVQILNSIQKLGEATTNEIRRATGLTNSEVQYRRDKLEELGLINATPRDTRWGADYEYEWSLTGTARRELERGLGVAENWLIYEDYDGDEVDPVEFRKMQEELQRLREKQKASAYDNQDDDREYVEQDEFREFENYVYDWHEGVEKYLYALRNVVEQYVPGVENLANHWQSKE